jgi:hypothetical protein
MLRLKLKYFENLVEKNKNGGEGGSFMSKAGAVFWAEHIANRRPGLCAGI